jgi:hypothetical protein
VAEPLSAEALTERLAEVVVGAGWAITGIEHDTSGALKVIAREAVNDRTAVMHTRSAVLPFYATAGLRARRRRELEGR